jgi:methylase of polypeptide subunit release factors
VTESGSDPDRTEPPLAVPDASTLAALRAALQQASYTERDVAAALGSRPPLARTREAVYRLRLAETGHLGTLICLFRLGERVPRDAAADALAPAELDALLTAGFLTEHDGQIAAAIELSPSLGLVVAHDRNDAARRAPPWHVMFGAASRTLAALTIRRRVRTALDIGTGTGIQALLAARHAERVVATDVSERALRFARVNAALNGIDNVEWRQGDLFEPVANERFGLIVSNPPFVISPDTNVMFRDSPLPRDEVSGFVVAAAGEHLEDGGHATVLCSWIGPADGHWSTPPRGWIPGGCDGVVLQFTAAEPLDYAAMWTDELDRWLAYYRGAGIERISIGAVVLRRRSGEGRIVAYQANRAPREDAGEQLERVLDAGDVDERSLLSGRFRLVAHELRQEASYRDGAYTINLTGIELRGAPLNARVEAEAIHVLPGLDGSATLAEVIDRAAAQTGVDRAALERAVLTTARRLYERGFLVRVA